jgi:hypothetical protein
MASNKQSASPDAADHPHIVLIGAGIMSATLGVLLKELQPGITIDIHERPKPTKSSITPFYSIQAPSAGHQLAGGTWILSCANKLTGLMPNRFWKSSLK